MKTPEVKLPQNINFKSLVNAPLRFFERQNPLILMAAGAAILIGLGVFLFSGGASRQKNQETLEIAQQSMSQVSGVVQDVRRVLEDQEVQEMAVMALADPGKLSNLQQYIRGRIPELIEVELFDNDLGALRGEQMGPYGYAVLDMLLSARQTGLVSAQIHGQGADAYMTLAVRVGAEDSPAGYLMAKFNPDILVSVFQSSLAKPGLFALEQFNGQTRSTRISDFAVPPTAAERLMWLHVPASLFRVGAKQKLGATGSLGIARPLVFSVGAFLLALGVMLKIRPHRPPEELSADLKETKSVSDEFDEAEASGVDRPEPRQTDAQGSTDTGDGLGAVALPDLGFNLEKMNKPRKRVLPPVELTKGIFRAYDIRGIVDKTLDAEVARQVGQVIGSLALEQDAGPVVVARDGRKSGPDLAAGMIEGVASTGCDVVDIGAAPTGVLYFAAYELGKGTGVMVTGSHNPPEYNGIKMMIGGITQAGDDITGMYDRIRGGNLRVGRGRVSKKNMLFKYRERISSDIKLERPLKVVADCGNGIGGVCVADVLRGIGADVFTLFDEVDGSFPNHHPDPSDPRNLEDLIDAVKMMNADIGVAFDGDADRLGVVTSDGEIIYSDRLMMLFVKDVLSRVPGSTIIYDVKCTGHLHGIIEEAGGKPMMYKTGHSLIKNKMKEVNAPFAGEMSGHFFFKERWYGFDCGIYSAARLLEILAADERDPAVVLNELPNSISTPELKCQMNEGENHAFVAEMQEKAHFVDARITTIDGVRVDFSDGWGLVRASNTTPILVLRFEADNDEALRRIKNIFRQQMLAINSQLTLPF
jgi:phosphomannomutase/phosphoglucomutase